MFCVFRVDLDYVPWDTPDAQDFGHGEPAMIIKLLNLTRDHGIKLHFFMSGRSIRAFPHAAEAVLADGHHLDWLCKHPHEMDLRWSKAEKAFALIGNQVKGVALRNPWPEDLINRPAPESWRFVSGPSGPTWNGLKYFEVTTRPERDAHRAGQTIRAWLDGVKAEMRHLSAVGKVSTVVTRPQVLANLDPKLRFFKELLEFSKDLELKQRTYRDVLAEESN